MARIRMAVEIHNESNVPLRLNRSTLDWGDWTEPWRPTRHPAIAPGATAEFRAEGNLAAGISTNGTEGTVWYDVDGDPSRPLRIHWNSPLIESQYANTFEIEAPEGFSTAHSGGQGGQARLVVRFQRTEKRSVGNFRPSLHGFHFSNHWGDMPVVTIGRLWNALREAMPGAARDLLGIVRVDDDWLPITSSDQGMCGGMVFAAMDYWNGGELPPATNRPPGHVDDPLFPHVRDRLLASFDVDGSGHRWLGYSSPHYPNGDEGVIQFAGLARGRSWVTYRDEWPRIRDDIDHGRLSPVGLIQTTTLDIGANHQVLAYAYQQSGQHVQLWIYDPNLPDDDDITLNFDITSTDGEVHVDRRLGARSVNETRIWCIIRMDGYEHRRPPCGRSGRARITQVAAVHPRRQIEGSAALFAADAQGTAFSAHWPDAGSAWSSWYWLERTGLDQVTPLRAVSTRREPDGSVSLFTVDRGGQVISAYWPESGTTNWSSWFSIGENTFPAGSAVTAVRTRNHQEGAVSLFLVGHDGRVWSAYWPHDDTANWSNWFPVGDNTFPLGSTVTAVKTRGDVDGAVSLFVTGHNGRIWSAYWPEAGTSNWSGWFAVGENTFPVGATVAAVRTRRRLEGSVSLFVTRQDGRVWSAYWPDAPTANWSAWFPLGDNTFPVGNTVTAIQTRDQLDGSVSLFVTGHDGRIWSTYWPAGDTAYWSSWFPLGDSTFPTAGTVTAVRTRDQVDGSVSLFVTGSDGRLWSAYWPEAGTSDWSPWFPIGDIQFVL